MVIIYIKTKTTNYQLKKDIISIQIIQAVLYVKSKSTSELQFICAHHDQICFGLKYIQGWEYIQQPFTSTII